jgi:hypothetical protein
MRRPRPRKRTKAWILKEFAGEALSIERGCCCGPRRVKMVSAAKWLAKAPRKASQEVRI